jgi:heme/copper-type cytochrome/quinol oxidase subunit 2
MGSDDWIHAHAHGVLWAIEVMWVAGFLAIFVVYFVIKHRIKKKKAEAAQKKEPVE